MKEKSNSTIDNEEIARFSRIAEEWWDEHGKFKPLHRLNPTRLRYIRDTLCTHFSRNADMPAPLQGLSLLDIGCGGGLVAEPMQRLGADVTAIDASEKNIQVARLHAEQSGLSIDYRAMPAEQLLAEGTAFDVVLALEIIEHVADVPAFIAASTGLLKPGGMIIYSTLNRTPLSYGMAIIGAEYIMRWLPIGTHDWKKFLRPSELCAELRAAHMTISDMTGLTYHPLRGEWGLDAHDLRVNYMLAAYHKS